MHREGSARAAEMLRGDAVAQERTTNTRTKFTQQIRSSWNAKEKGQEGSRADFLSELGTAQNYNINVDHGEPAVLHSAERRT